MILCQIGPVADTPAAVPAPKGIEDYNNAMKHARNEARHAAIADIRGMDTDGVVVRDLFPSDFGWGETWRQTGMEQGEWSTTFDGEDADAVVVVFGVSLLQTPATGHFRLCDVMTSRAVSQPLEGTLRDPSIVGLFHVPVAFTGWIPTVKQYGRRSGDGRLMLHGTIAERPGATIGSAWAGDRP